MPRSTPTVGRLLGKRPGTILHAIFEGRLAPPPKGPGGVYLWGARDIDRASRILLGRPYVEQPADEVAEPQPQAQAIGA